MTNISFSNMVERWPSAFVARTKILEFTGGILSEKYLANLDSQGRGIPGRIRVGRRICYPVTEVVKWLEARSTLVPERHPK